MDLVLLHTVPNDAVHNVTGKVAQAKLTLWAEHLLVVLVLTHVSLHRLDCFNSIARIHDHLHVQKLVIILEELFHLVIDHKFLGLVLTEGVNIDFALPSSLTLLLALFVLL